MRKLGILGGMSWESSALYYTWLNQEARRRLGGLSSAKVILNSVEFAEVARLQHDGNWTALETLLVQEARNLEAAGCELILIATNTMHLLYEAICNAVNLPVLHIADGTGNALQAGGYKLPLLLATAFTMEKAFYRDRLSANFGIDCLIPDHANRKETHRIIYEELCQGKISQASKDFFENLILATPEADSLILGCTELTMIIDSALSPVPLVDTTNLHVQTAMDAMLA